MIYLFGNIEWDYHYMLISINQSSDMCMYSFMQLMACDGGD